MTVFPRHSEEMYTTEESPPKNSVIPDSDR